MSQYLRLTLFWLLALAMPLQGLAATTALCAASHPPAQESGDATASVHAPHEHAHHADDTMHHDIALADDLRTPAAPDCNAGADCCVGVALSSHLPPGAIPTPTRARYPTEILSPAAFFAEGPYHPPRPIRV